MISTISSKTIIRAKMKPYTINWWQPSLHANTTFYFLFKFMILQWLFDSVLKFNQTKPNENPTKEKRRKEERKRKNSPTNPSSVA